MTGQELIDWIKENHAEDYEVVKYIEEDNLTVAIDPGLCKERTHKFIDGKYKTIEKCYIEI